MGKPENSHSHDKDREIQEYFKRKQDLNTYLLVSIGMQSQFRAPTPRGVIKPLPHTDEELSSTIREMIFSNPWYGARGTDMIETYLDRELAGIVPEYSLVERCPEDPRTYRLTTRGEAVLESRLEKHEEDPSNYPHITAILENIHTANAA